MDKQNQKDSSSIKSLIAEKIAGEVTFSEKPGDTLCKWREEFGVTQTQLAKKMDISPSVISDYESGRRKSPGIKVIEKFINSLIKIDESREGNVLKELERIVGVGTGFEGVISMDEYSKPMDLNDFVRVVEGELLFSNDSKTSIKGFTVIDSLEAIQKLSPEEFYRLYGWSTERALIFCGVTTGKSPLVAIRVTNLKPAVVVLHGINEVDPVAIKLAEIEKVPLVKTKKKLDEIMNQLGKEV